MNRIRLVVCGALSVLLLAATGFDVAAQATDPNAIGGLEAYWYVFIAYAVVIVLVLGWVISIGLRLRDVEERLGQN